MLLTEHLGSLFNKFVSMLLILCLFTSCGNQALLTKNVEYQSVRTKFKQPQTIPDDIEILVAYIITDEGLLCVGVENRTDEIMLIDQTMSFFINSNGKSVSYYDPTVYQTSTTTSQTNTLGASVNLGILANALSISGPLGFALGGVNVGNVGSTGSSTTDVSIFSDQQRVALGPKGAGAMSKSFKIVGVGQDTSHAVESSTGLGNNCEFSVCISYSVDGGKTFTKIVTDFYVNSNIIVPVFENENINEALRTIYQTKPDALGEPIWHLHFNSNHKIYTLNNGGVLYDYQ